MSWNRKWCLKSAHLPGLCFLTISYRNVDNSPASNPPISRPSTSSWPHWPLTSHLVSLISVWAVTGDVLQPQRNEVWNTGNCFILGAHSSLFNSSAHGGWTCRKKWGGKWLVERTVDRCSTMLALDSRCSCTMNIQTLGQTSSTVGPQDEKHIKIRVMRETLVYSIHLF